MMDIDKLIPADPELKQTQSFSSMMDIDKLILEAISEMLAEVLAL